MELDTHIEGAVRELHGFHNVVIGGGAADDESRVLKGLPEVVVEFIAVAVALVDVAGAVGVEHPGAGSDPAGVRPQTQGAALGHAVALVRQEVNDLVGALVVEFAGVGVLHSGHAPGKGDDTDLHSQTDAEVGHLLFPAVVGGGDHAVDAPAAEAAGHDDAGAALQNLGHILPGNGLGIDPADVHIGAQLIARVAQGLGNGQVGVVELHIFAHQADGDGAVPAVDPVEHGVPVRQIDVRGVDLQLPADDAGEILLFQHNGGFVQAGQGDVFNDAVLFHVAEHGDFLEDAVLQGLVAAQDDDVRLDPHALQLLDGVLGGLALVLIGAPEEGHQGHMDKQAVGRAHLQRDLPHRLQEGLGLDVANGAADFRDDHVRVGLLAHPVDKFLDLVGDVGNDLDGGAQIFPLALLVQHVPVHLAGGQVGVFVQILVNKTLVVAQVQVGFRAVLGDVHLSVLVGAHGARVHVDIGIQLLGGHLQPPGLQQSAQRRGGNALAQAGNHAAGNENIFCLLHIETSRK